MDYLYLGGIFIWPILIESILAAWIIVERLFFMTVVLPRKSRALRSYVVSVESNQSNAAFPVLNDFPLAVHKSFEEKCLNVSLLTLAADRMVGEVERYLTALHIIAQSAPLFGLLGTVTGMIRVFMTIQSLEGHVNPSDLAGGIWEALITTAAGLIVGIPSLIAYIGFNRLADAFAIETESAVSRIVHKAAKSEVKVL